MIYNSLSAEDKLLYDTLYKAITEEKDSCTVKLETDSDIKNINGRCFDILQIMRCNVPEFYFTDTAVVDRKCENGEYVLKILYYIGHETLKTAQEVLDFYINNLYESIKHLPDYEYALAVFEWLTENVTYTLLLDGYMKESVIGCVDERLFNTLFGVFTDGTSVCDGYSGAFSLMMKKRGIECMICRSACDRLRHVWNMVKLGGEWCHVDACWADRGELISGEDVGMSNYLFFGMTEDEAVFDMRGLKKETDFSKVSNSISFIPMDKSDWPKADSDVNNYYLHEGLYFTNEDFDEITHRIIGKLQKDDSDGDKRISIRFESADTMQKYREVCIEMIKRELRKLNETRKNPIRVSSGEISKKYRVMDLFFRKKL